MKKILSILLILMLVVGTMAGCGGKSDATGSENVEINWATISGFYTDFMTQIAADFEAETGIKVNIIQIDNGVMYEKQGIEMASKTGAYDIVTNETMWKAEWANAGYILPLNDYINEAGLTEDFKNFDPGTFRLAGEWNGKIYSIPFYTYNQGMFVRQDLFDDPTEQAAFKAKYGYDLVVPTDWDQYTDVAEFFTRPAGAMLKGAAIENPIYGCGLMAGRFPEIQDENMAILWGLGGDVIDNTGKAVINSEIGVKGIEIYTNLLDNYAPPGAKTSSYDEVIAQLKEGLIAMTGPMFLDQWANAVQTEDLVPGSHVEPYQTPNGRGYIGAFGLSVTSDSKHPQEAFEFLAYLSNYENTKKFALGGGSPIRMDVLTDPEVVSDANRKKTGGLKMLAQAMEAQKDCDYAIFKSPAAGKIYEEMMIHYNIASNHEKTYEEAMEMLANKINELNEPYMNADFFKQ